MKKIFVTLSITMVGIFILFVTLYFVGARGEAYNAAVKFIGENDQIRRQLGSVEKCRLAFFGYSLRYTGPRGYAEYKILVVGDRGKGAVYLDMERTLGVWEIRKGNLIMQSGEAIQLKEVS